MIIMVIIQPAVCKGIICIFFTLLYSFKYKNHWIHWNQRMNELNEILILILIKCLSLTGPWILKAN